MEFLTSCLWKFCLISGILGFSDGNSRIESDTLAESEEIFNDLKEVSSPDIWF